MIRTPQKSYLGKGPAHYVNNASLDMAPGGTQEVFYGKGIILTITNRDELVLHDVNGVLAVLEGLSRHSVAKMVELMAMRHI